MYRGTDERGHHFTYSWNTNNRYHQRKYVIGPELITLNLPTFKLTKDYTVWTEVQPTVGSSGTLSSFAPKPQINTFSLRVYPPTIDLE